MLFLDGLTGLTGLTSMNVLLFEWLTKYLFIYLSIYCLIHVVEGTSANSPVTQNHLAIMSLQTTS